MVDLPPGCLATVRDLLALHAPRCEVLAFGSRVTGGARPYSDLDLALVGASRIPLEELQRLREAFEDSPLPMRVDLVDWLTLPASLRAAIAAAHEVIRRPDPAIRAIP
jgi:predicted nucleotidyltransferase